MNVKLSLTEQPDGRWRWGVGVGMEEKEHGVEPSQLAAQSAGEIALDLTQKSGWRALWNPGDSVGALGGRRAHLPGGPRRAA